ncbi:CHAT domain-containing protein [Spongiimicrobium salis]|uniref:CHAT domain-containing protein n=1 Tax=Spongiimicrobium salis TaxID=1667022 RepID=UPI00374D30D1
MKKEADSLFKERKYRKAAELYNTAADGYISSKLWERGASCYNGEANCYLNTRDYKKAYSRLRTSLKTLKNEVGRLTYEEGQAYDLISYYYELDLSDFDTSEEYLEKSLEVFQKLPNEELAVVREINNIAYISIRKGDFQKTLEYSIKGIHLLEEKQIDNDGQKANLYSNLGIAYNGLGNYEAALPNFEKANEINIQIFGPKHPKIADNYMNLGALHKNLSNYKKSIAFNKKALEVGLVAYGEKHPFIGRIYINISNDYRKINQYENALEYAEKSLTLLHEIYGRDHFDAEVTLKNLSIIYHELGDTDKAIAYALRALELNRKTLGEHHEKTASAFDYLGNYYAENKQYNRSITYYEKALDIYKNKYPDGHYRIAGIYEGLALSYDDLSQDSLSKIFWEKSLEMNKKLFPKGNPRRIASEIIVGHSYLKRKQFSKAKMHLDTASVELAHSNFKGLEHNGDEDRYVYNEQYLELSKLTAKIHLENYLKDGNVEMLHKALKEYRKADEVIDNMRKYYSQYSDKIRYAKETQFIYHSAIRTSLMNRTENDSANLNAFYYAEKSKFNILKELLKEDAASSFAGMPSTVLETELNLKKKRAYYSSKIVNMNNPLSTSEQESLKGYQEQLFKINRSHDSLLESIQVQYPNYFEFKYKNDVLGPHEIQKRLPPKTSLLEYVQIDSISYAFVVSKDAFHVKALNTEFLESKITSFRNAMTNKDIVLFKEVGHELYRMLVEPIVQEVRGEELIIVPDGVLWNLNFELLLTQMDISNNPKELSYFLKRFPISYGNSANVLFGSFQREKSVSNECLAFSFSDLTEVDSGSVLRLSTLRDSGDDLPGTRAEIKEIAKIIDGTYYYGKEAVEANFKSQASKYAILHLALHGEVDHVNPENSKLYFTQSADTIEDNFLYSHELFALDLPADLAVLSACNTGTGKVSSGEGIMSLGNTFQYAGTKSLLLSSWEVSDQVAPELMKLFYQNLRKGYTKSKALQNAKLTFLDTASSSRSHPFYWGSFYILGDNASISLRSYNLFLIGSIVIVTSILIGFTFYRKKRMK